MASLPVIVGFGGYNAAGRSSSHQSYQRMVIDSLSPSLREETLLGLAVMMGRVHYSDGVYQNSDGLVLSKTEVIAHYESDILENTLVRRIGKEYFDVDKVPTHQKIPLSHLSEQVSFDLSKRQLPTSIPDGWDVIDIDDKTVKVTIHSSVDSATHANSSARKGSEPTIKVDSCYESSVKAAGQLPDNFDPSRLYASRFHPRGLQLSIIGASDAINSMGVEWETILQHVAPDQIGVYSTSVMSQLDQNGLGGLLQARLKGERVTTKQLALGLNSMPADFINAYVIGSMGTTGSIAGACASFLYNLQAGMEDIRSGRRKVVIVGSSEAPITPEIIDGYATMSALVTDDKLCKLDASPTPNYRRASRPFGENAGFTIAESTQQVVLMDDALAVELGATIHGSVLDVFVNADGYKKSISAPGPGNYLTLAKAVASARNLLGDEAVQQRSFVQAHGSSTPQNRTTESQIFDRVAEAFGIEKWPVIGVKAYVGHSLAAASGDQLINSLGIFKQGIIPGIKTIDSVADDVVQKRLQISTDDVVCKELPDIAFLNSKGFGGNNATACILSPKQTKEMLVVRHGNEKMMGYSQRNQAVEESAERYHQAVLQGDFRIRYNFGKDMVSEDDIELSEKCVGVHSFGQVIDLTNENLYKDMIK